MSEKAQSRREFLKRAGIGTAAAALPGLLNWTCRPPEKKPNVLFLFSDDQRFDTISALGNPHIFTPNLDRLVNKGVSFTRAHIMGGTSGAVCIPSRAMLLTGKTLFHLENQGGTIPEDHVMLPEVLRMSGYKTYGIGKWHNGRPAFARCFMDGGKIFFGGMSDHLQVPIFEFDPAGLYPAEKSTTGHAFSSQLFSDEAIRFLDTHPKDSPFFLYVSYTAPHDPRMAPQEFQNLYPTGSIPLPPNFLPEHPFDNGEMKVRDENLAGFPRRKEDIAEHLSAYYAMISHLDAQIGRVLDTLEKTGRERDTIVIFAGDNGLAVGQHGLLGKQNIYDHSVRVPLLISGPGIPEGQRRDSLCTLADIFPTLCEMLDLPRPESVEGRSLVPSLQDKDVKIRESVFLAYRKFQRGIRTDDDWKLLEYNVRGRRTTQLFELKKDPWETANLASDPVFSDQKSRLSGLLKQHMRELGDFCDLDEPNWGLPEEKTDITKISHMGAGRQVTLLNDATPEYCRNGAQALADGIQATSQFNDGHWLGLRGDDLDAQVDLGRIRSVRKITVNFLEKQESWIFFPAEIEMSLSSDGKNFVPIERIHIPLEKNIHTETRAFSAETSEAEARFVRIRARSIGDCPGWHIGSGEKAWVFADEIVIL